MTEIRNRMYYWHPGRKLLVVSVDRNERRRLRARGFTAHTRAQMALDIRRKLKDKDPGTYVVWMINRNVVITPTEFEASTLSREELEA